MRRIMSKITLRSTITLNDGIQMPLFGLGMFQMALGQNSVIAVRCALQNGYRLIDTAAFYNNESEVGQAVKEAGIPREEVFIVTKVKTDGHGYDECKKAAATSLAKLNSGYIDLHLIHSPHGGKLVQTYDALLDLKKEGLIRSVGVSNFNIHHLEGLKKAGRPAPSVNQIELHTFLKQQPVVDYCRANNIALMAYCPLAKNKYSDDPVLMDMAKRYNKTVPQIMIRWCVEQGFITIPKSEKETRILENSQVFDFSLSAQDMEAINKLPEHRTSWNPLTEPWSG